MKIGALTPDRGDRPQFLRHAMRFSERQTFKPAAHLLVCDPPRSTAPDLGWRVREGLEMLFAGGCDAVAIIENDDYYAPGFLDSLVREWSRHDRPPLFGFDETIYYHAGLRAWSRLRHPGRASLCSTLVTSKALSVSWSEDTVFLDLLLWAALPGVAIPVPGPPEMIGIKHGVGLCGGTMHHSVVWEHGDPDLEWLRGHVDEESLRFYEGMAE